MKRVWHLSAWNAYVDWQVDDRKTLKRIDAITDVQCGDGGGIGKPELLKRDLSGWASGRINEEHHLVNRTDDANDELVILTCPDHGADRERDRWP